MESSRRRFMQAVVGGAVVLGFDLRTRSWITRVLADRRGDGQIVGLPPLDGELRLAGVEPSAADFAISVMRGDSYAARSSSSTRTTCSLPGKACSASEPPGSGALSRQAESRGSGGSFGPPRAYKWIPISEETA
jgi:hypothetical protein